MAKVTTPFTAQERVILFCAATGISPTAVGITAHAMQSMAIKGFITHNRETGDYPLTDSGRATLLAVLGEGGLTSGRTQRKRPDPPDRYRRAVACLNTQSPALVAVRVTLVHGAGCADVCRTECFACRRGDSGNAG